MKEFKRLPYKYTDAEKICLGQSSNKFCYSLYKARVE